MSGDRKITSGDTCKFSRKFVRIVGSYFSIIVVYKNIVVVYKNIVAVYIDNVESKVDILQPGLFISSLFIRYAPFKNKEKPRKTNKNRGLKNKKLFFLVSFCFYLFLKGAERKSRRDDRNGFSHMVCPMARQEWILRHGLLNGYDQSGQSSNSSSSS